MPEETTPNAENGLGTSTPGSDNGLGNNKQVSDSQNQDKGGVPYDQLLDNFKNTQAKLTEVSQTNAEIRRQLEEKEKARAEKDSRFGQLLGEYFGFSPQKGQESQLLDQLLEDPASTLDKYVEEKLKPIKQERQREQLEKFYITQDQRLENIKQQLVEQGFSKAYTEKIVEEIKELENPLLQGTEKAKLAEDGKTAWGVAEMFRRGSVESVLDEALGKHVRKNLPHLFEEIGKETRQRSFVKQRVGVPGFAGGGSETPDNDGIEYHVRRR